MISLIWAMTKDRLVGKGNLIPWHIKEDLLYYKEKTKGKTVLMGDQTYDSLKGYYKTKPLPYGKIYVVSLSEREFPDAIKVSDVKTFLDNLEEDLMVVGGPTIYKLALPYANYLYISWVKKSYEGDRYFPEFDLDDYELISSRDSVEVVYTVYKRK